MNDIYKAPDSDLSVTISPEEEEIIPDVFLLMSLSNLVLAASLALFSFAICLALSKRTLDGEQTRLLYKWKIGKLKI